MSDKSVESTSKVNQKVVCRGQILFRNLKPFPVIDETTNFKIVTEDFLESSNQIVDALACFGLLFYPIVEDMRKNVRVCWKKLCLELCLYHQNIREHTRPWNSHQHNQHACSLSLKVTEKYKQNETLFHYLEDLILKDNDDNMYDEVTNYLLWLKRALQTMEQFFRNILEDKRCREDVKPHLKQAYEKFLKPFHSILTQKAFQLTHLNLPTRSSILGPSGSNMDNVKALEEFLAPMRANLNHLDEFYTQHNLQRTYKV